MATKRVRCIDPGINQLIKGKVYDACDSQDPEFIYVTNDEGAQGKYYAHRFEPVMDRLPDDMCLAGGFRDNRTAKDTQVDGSHYTKLAIQPYEYCTANNIPYIESNAIKYLTRWRDKGGIRDLEKAVHSIQWLIEWETNKRDRS